MTSDPRITEIHIHKLAGEITERFGWSLGWTKRRTATLVEVRTDSGITGWGDGFFGGEHLLRHPEKVIGRSPFEIEAIYDALRPPMEMQRRRQGQVCGGLDTALWDIAGQALNLPVARLFGQVHRDRVQAYCTALYRKDWPDLARGLADEACEWKRQGFKTVKMKVGFGPDLDHEIVTAVREAVGADCGLAIDANCAYDSSTAQALGKRLEQSNIKWFEEPVLADNFDGYRRLRAACSIPLAGGETLDADQLLRDYIQPRLVDILQPEVEIVGLTGARRVSLPAWLNHIQIVPHNWGTTVRTVAILHWMATAPPITEALATPPALFEFDRTEHPFRDAVVENKVHLLPDGCVPLPAGSGLGISINTDAVARFREEYTILR